jgi:hypothetical protein
MAGVFKSLDRSDVRITPFRTYKLWPDVIVNNLSGSVYTIYKADYNPKSNYLREDPLKDTFDQLNSTFEASEPTTANGKFQRVVHRSLDHLYYRDFYTNNKASFGSGNINAQFRYLEDYATVISMPQSKFGEAILPGSVDVNVSWSYNVFQETGSNVTQSVAGVWNIVDDFHGNLVISGSGLRSPYSGSVGGAIVGSSDTNYTSSIDASTVGEWPIDDIYKYTDVGNVSFDSVQGKSDWQTKAQYNNISVTFPTTQPDMALMGAMMLFQSSSKSNITVKAEQVKDYAKAFNFFNSDFSINMVISPTEYPTHPSGSVLVTKHGPAEELQVDENGNIYSQPVTNQFPYRISYVSQSNKIAFEKGGGDSVFMVTSSAQILPGNLYQITVSSVASPSGSAVALHVNSNFSSSIDTKVCTLPDSICGNLADVFIGNNYNYTENGITCGFSGYIDNIKFYKKALSTNEIKILHHTLGVGNTIVGSVFYNHGMMVLTSIPSRNATINTVSSRGTHTIWETEILCTIGPGEFTRSTNPTLQEYSPTKNQYVFRSFATGSMFNPFVTTIGLYDDYFRLVAIGKMSTPVQLPNNVDTTVIVRIDR